MQGELRRWGRSIAISALWSGSLRSQAPCAFSANIGHPLYFHPPLPCPARGAARLTWGFLGTMGRTLGGKRAGRSGTVTAGESCVLAATRPSEQSAGGLGPGRVRSSGRLGPRPPFPVGRTLHSPWARAAGTVGKTLPNQLCHSPPAGWPSGITNFPLFLVYERKDVIWFLRTLLSSEAFFISGNNFWISI